MVTPLPFNFRQAVRDTELLGYYIPAGTNVMTWPSAEPPAARAVDRSGEVRSRLASPNPATSTSSTATRSPRSAAARTSASAWCSASWRSRPSCTGCCASYRLELPHPGYKPRYWTTAACRCRSTACRSSCVRCTDPVGASTRDRIRAARNALARCSPTVAGQSCSRLAQATTRPQRRLRRVVGPPHRPRVVGVPSAPADEGRDLRRRPAAGGTLMHLDGERRARCSISVNAATGPIAAAADVPMRSPTAMRGLVVAGPAAPDGGRPRSASVHRHWPSRTGPEAGA